MPYNPDDMFLGAINASQFQEEDPIKRYGKQFVRSATLGFAGSQQEPKGIGEHIAEFAGGIVPIAAISAIASPVAGAGLRLLNIPKIAIPLTSRLATAAAVGAGTQAGFDISGKGETSLSRVGLGALVGTAQEGLFLVGKARAKAKVKIPVEETLQAEKASNTADILDEVIGTRQLPPSTVRKPLALPAVGETQSTHPTFQVSPMPGSASGRIATGKTRPRVEQLETGFQPTKGIFEVNKETGEVTPVSFNVEQTRQKFHVGRDAETGLPELISKDNITDQAIKLASVSPPKLSPVNIVKQITKQKLDLAGQRQPIETSNLIKQPENVVKDLVNTDKPVGIADYIAMDYTQEAIQASSIAKKLGMDEKTLVALQDAIHQIKDPAVRSQILKQKLEELCG